MRRCILGKGRERELEEEKEAKAIAGKVFDKKFQRIDVSLFCSSDTMLNLDLQRVLTQVLNLNWLSALH